jgi:heptosyltransferase-2
VLIVKLADLGDLLLGEPAIRSLRVGLPDAELDLLVPPTAAGLARLLGHDVQIQVFPKGLYDQLRGMLYPRRAAAAADLALRLRRRRYDLVVLLHHLTTHRGTQKFRALVAAAGAREVVGLDNGRGTFLTAAVDDLGFGVRHESDYMLAVARRAGGADVDPRPRFELPDEPEYLDLPAPYAVIAPVSGPYSPARNWPVARFAALASRLSSSGWNPVIVGADDAAPAARAILDAAPAVDMTGKTTLVQLASVIARADVVIGNDSFVGHLAAALARPVVAIFGPSNSAAWRPYGAVEDVAAPVDARSIVVREDMPCAPCLYTGFRLGRRSGCSTRTCLDLVTIERVVEAARRVSRQEAA